MRMHVGLTLAAVLAVAGCGGTAAQNEPTSTPSTQSAPAKFTDPEQMRSLLQMDLMLQDCDPTARDANGALFVQCATPDGVAVRMSTFKPSQHVTEALLNMEWQVYGDTGWNVAVGYGSSSKTDAELAQILDEASTRLLKG